MSVQLLPVCEPCIVYILASKSDPLLYLHPVGIMCRSSIDHCVCLLFVQHITFGHLCVTYEVGISAVVLFVQHITSSYLCVTHEVGIAAVRQILMHGTSSYHVLSTQAGPDLHQQCPPLRCFASSVLRCYRAATGARSTRQNIPMRECISGHERGHP